MKSAKTKQETRSSKMGQISFYLLLTIIYFILHSKRRVSYNLHMSFFIDYDIIHFYTHLSIHLVFSFKNQIQYWLFSQYSIRNSEFISSIFSFSNGPIGIFFFIICDDTPLSTPALTGSSGDWMTGWKLDLGTLSRPSGS